MKTELIIRINCSYPLHCGDCAMQGDGLLEGFCTLFDEQPDSDDAGDSLRLKKCIKAERVAREMRRDASQIRKHSMLLSTRDQILKAWDTDLKNKEKVLDYYYLSEPSICVAIDTYEVFDEGTIEDIVSLVKKMELAR